MKTYILWVTTKSEDGYSSKWYGWSRELKFTHSEALKKKETLKDKFYDIEVVEA